MIRRYDLAAHAAGPPVRPRAGGRFHTLRAHPEDPESLVVAGTNLDTYPGAEVAVLTDPKWRPSTAPNAGLQVFRDTVGGPVAAVVSSVSLPAGGSGTIEDVAFSGEAQYFFFRVTQLDESGNADRVWTAPVWFQAEPEAPPVVPPPPPPGPLDLLVASRRSEVYHLSLECLDAQRIRESNRVTGPAAMQGRRLHAGCPRTQ